MLRNFAIYIAAFTIALNAIGQTSSVDSLKALIPYTKNDTIKVNQLNILSRELMYSDPLEAMLYAKQSLNLSRQSVYKSGKAEALYLLGVHARNNNQYNEAIEYFKESLLNYRELGNSDQEAEVHNDLGTAYSDTGDTDRAISHIKKALIIHEANENTLGIAASYFQLGAIYNTLGDNKKAFQYTTDALEIFEKYDSKDNVWSTMNNLGIIHDDLGMYPKALEYYLGALEIVDEIGDEEGKIVLSNNIGIIYEIINDYDRALEYFQQALVSSKKLESESEQAGLHNNIALIYANLNDIENSLHHYRKAIDILERNAVKCELPYPLEGLADLYMQQGMLDSALIYFDRALILAEECHTQVVIITIYKNLGRLHGKQGRIDKSIKSFEKSLSLALKNGYKNDIKENAEELYKKYKELGRYKTALEYHEMFKSAQDSLFNNNNTQSITRLADEYEFHKELQALEHEQEKQNMQHQARLHREELIRNTILIVLILAVLLVITLGRSFYLIQKRNRQLTQLNEEKNTLIGVVAHDLRSPLNNIKAMMPLMRSEVDRLSESQVQFLELMTTSVDRMGEMIKRVLDINAIEAQKINLKMEACDLGETLDMTAQNFYFMTEEKGVKVEKDIKHRRHYAHVDKNYLIQVVENIISNAIKFSNPENHIYLNVESDGDKEKIKIKDEGPGISEDDQKKMFAKFQKLSAKPTANESSTGLGLSIAKKYIEAMQGKIWCESNVGQGATFIIEFNSIRSSVY